MAYVPVQFKMESAKKTRVVPLLHRNGMTLSSFLRKCVDDYLETHENEIASRAQSFPSGFGGGDAA